MRFRRRIITWALIFAGLIAVFLYFVLDQIGTITQQNTNTLAIGSRAIVESLAVPLAEPVDLDGKTRDEIYAMRTAAALQYPWLLYTNYEPSHAVFSQIEAGKPWWGIAGEYYYGSGEMSTAGPSEESRFILNPYLLVAADFSGLSIWSGRPGDSFWKRDIITNAALESNNFPFYVPARDLRWWPSRGRVEVSYDLSGYIQHINTWTARKYSYRDANFDLIAYNARDLNLNYIYVDYEKSFYITKDPAPVQAVNIPQYIHQGDSCGYEGGCNNMSPATPEIMGIQIQRLPAKLILYLWQDAPSDLTETPDITYVINIR